MTILCLQYKGVRIGLARKNYSTLKKTTLVSLFEVFNNFGLKKDEHYNYNSMTGIITFENGSEIVMIDLDYYPSDPEYTKLGGLLLTMAFIDEAGELINEKGYNILISRCGRWMNDEYKLKPIIVSTCNPSTNFLKEKFYQPYSQNRLPKDVKFIPALLTDNPNLGDQYRQNLERSLDHIQKRRLLLGDWDFDSTDLDMFLAQDIEAMYSKSSMVDYDAKDLYLTVDVAVDRDDTIAILWKGLEVLDIIVAKKNIENHIFVKELVSTYDVPLRNVIYDASGVGGPLKKSFPSAKGFFGNGKVVGKVNYGNLRNQCYFKLSEYVSNNKITISTLKEKDRLKKELMVLKRKEVILNKVEMMNKKEIKQLLGNSPDIADALMMRMMLELRNTTYKPF